MNKKYEKFINKKNNYSISIQSNKSNKDNNRKIKSSKILNMRKKNINFYYNINPKNTFTLKFD